MMNEKLILETVANLTKGLAGLQAVVAGLSQLLSVGLPNLSPQQKAVLENGATTLLKEAEAQSAAGENILSAIRQSNLQGNS